MPSTHRIDRRILVALFVAALVAASVALVSCAPDEPQEPQARDGVPAGTIDPEAWREHYPQEYEDWAATADPREARSRYKKGGEGERDMQYDKLSEYPFLAAMAKGIGFSVEFNEPRGHALALIDQNEIDPSRLKAGGVCLACKSPYYEPLLEEQGEKLYSMPYEEAMQLIPEEGRELGVTCINCHEPESNDVRYSALMADALKRVGTNEVDENQMRNAVCGQCHSTYTIPKKDGTSVGLFMPWDGGEYGNIRVEDIINTIESDPANAEWTQALTGLKLGYIRHPEFELFTRGDVHYRNGVTCVDCHQPYKVKGDAKVSDHNVMSPLDDRMRACRPCHPGMNEEQLRESVFHVQDNYIGGLLNAGYSVVADAQMIRTAIDSKVDTTTPEFQEAIGTYKQAFYRVAYLAGENSVGFHNAPESMRILSDALSYSERANAQLRVILARANVDVPPEVDLNLLSFIEERGERKLSFRPEQEFRDPRGVAEELWRQNLRELRGGYNGPAANAEALEETNSPLLPRGGGGGEGEGN